MHKLIECHGSLMLPPYNAFQTVSLKGLLLAELGFIRSAMLAEQIALALQST